MWKRYDVHHMYTSTVSHKSLRPIFYMQFHIFCNNSGMRHLNNKSLHTYIIMKLIVLLENLLFSPISTVWTSIFPLYGPWTQFKNIRKPPVLIVLNIILHQLLIDVKYHSLKTINFAYDQAIPNDSVVLRKYDLWENWHIFLCSY